MIYTLGHSTLSQEQFRAAVMKVEAPRLVVDIRSHPTSYLQHFWKQELDGWLPSVDDGIRYRWMRELGGWTFRHAAHASWMAKFGVDVTAYCHGKFPKQRISQSLPKQGHPTWTNVGLRDYSYYTLTDEFRAGVAHLRSMGKYNNVIIFCAEVQWWKCHRSLVSDVLFHLGVDSVHIMPRFRRDGSCAVKLEHHVDVMSDRILRYDPAIVKSWDNILS